MYRGPAGAASAGSRTTRKPLGSPALPSRDPASIARRMPRLARNGEAPRRVRGRPAGWWSPRVHRHPAPVPRLSGSAGGWVGLGCTSTARTWVRRQGRIMMSGTRRGATRSLIKLARRSSRSSGPRTPRTCPLRSSTPTRRVPPEVFANATIVRSAPSGPERSRLNSSVLPSGRFSRSTRSMLLGRSKQRQASGLAALDQALGLAATRCQVVAATETQTTGASRNSASPVGRVRCAKLQWAAERAGKSMHALSRSHSKPSGKPSSAKFESILGKLRNELPLGSGEWRTPPSHRFRHSCSFLCFLAASKIS